MLYETHDSLPLQHIREITLAPDGEDGRESCGT
jgi:hypothetical protein